MKQLKTTTISSSAHSKKAHGVLTNTGLVFLEHSWMRAKPEAAAIDSFQVHHGKPVKAGDAEVSANPRARSAVMRVAEKLAVRCA